MAKLEIAGRTAALVFDMTSWEEMEESVCTLDEIDKTLSGNQRLKHYREIIGILSKEGARKGLGEEMPAEWLRENLHPAEVRLCIAGIKAAIGEGMRMETKQGQDEVIDPVLAELEKKEGRDD